MSVLPKTDGGSCRLLYVCQAVVCVVVCLCCSGLLEEVASGVMLAAAVTHLVELSHLCTTLLHLCTDQYLVDHV